MLVGTATVTRRDECAVAGYRILGKRGNQGVSVQKPELKVIQKVIKHSHEHTHTHPHTHTHIPPNTHIYTTDVLVLKARPWVTKQ